jgi:hypothetical protein
MDIIVSKGGFRGGAEGAAAPLILEKFFFHGISLVLRSRHAYSQNISYIFSTCQYKGLSRDPSF